jgi:hypothetical protein
LDALPAWQQLAVTTLTVTLLPVQFVLSDLWSGFVVKQRYYACTNKDHVVVYSSCWQQPVYDDIYKKLQKPVWKVRFPNAPGGGAQDYEVRQPEMERCLMAFKAQLSNAPPVV